ncbi:hypothetical protein CYMTET_6850 [Cymbomonas tetramitiformis]|uniref:Uncharacterized protein n=1 Tax=Cymbomonas tetramitiformis TaxID=36881 RepID=A0AAE0GWM5_9CHLO|nr:hypothetical protein CYMTET_6850 [Cymbomonas tetramitiformis]
MSNVVALCTEIKKVAEMASLGDGVKASLLQPKILALKNDLKSRGAQSFAVQLLDAVLRGANFEIAEEGETQADLELPEWASAFLEDLGSVVKDLKKEFSEGPTETVPPGMGIPEGSKASSSELAAQFMLQFKTALEGSAGKENNKRLAQFEMKERAKSKVENYVREEHAHLMSMEMSEETDAGRMVRIPRQEAVHISALGLVVSVKGDGTVKARKIHDYSRPFGESINAACEKYARKFAALEDAYGLMRLGYWLGKLDLSKTYRFVGVAPELWKWLVCEWQGSCYMDTRLAMGLTAEIQ